MLCVGKFQASKRQHDESVPKAWERFQDYISECPHHGMENWLLMQTFYHGVTNNTHECDRTAQFIQDQVRLSPLNTLTRAYSHLYKPGSPPSVTQDLGKSTSQPRSRD